jgi:hypothetical protein
MKPYGKADIRSQVMKNGDFEYRLNDSVGGGEESPESLKGTTDKGNTANQGGLQVSQRVTNQRQSYGIVEYWNPAARLIIHSIAFMEPGDKLLNIT